MSALELVDKAGGDRFSFDDLEVATLLAGIAAAALAEPEQRPPDHPSAESLAGSLRALALRAVPAPSVISPLLLSVLGVGLRGYRPSRRRIGQRPALAGSAKLIDARCCVRTRSSRRRR